MPRSGLWLKGGKRPPPTRFQAYYKKTARFKGQFLPLLRTENGFTTDIFVVKYTGRGLVVKRPGVLSKDQMLNLVLGVGVFSLLPLWGPGISKITACFCQSSTAEKGLLEEMSVQGNICQNHPFGNHPLANPETTRKIISGGGVKWQPFNLAMDSSL